jgi:hypothetical protein
MERSYDCEALEAVTQQEHFLAVEPADEQLLRRQKLAVQDCSPI